MSPHPTEPRRGDVARPAAEAGRRGLSGRRARPTGLPLWADRLDRAASGAAVLLIATLAAFAAAAFGAVEPWSELSTLWLAAGIVLATLARWAAEPRRASPLAWAWAPLVGYVLLAALQLAPLSPGALHAIGSPAAGDRAELLGGEASPAAISVYPLATERSLRLMAVFAACFAAAVSLASDRGRVERLLTALLAVGAGEALLILYQRTTGSSLLWGVAGPAGGGAFAGSFVNHSNCAQMLNLSLGAGIGLLLARLESERRHGPGWGSRESVALDALRRHAPLIAGIGVVAVGVLMALSRNGVLSMAAAATVVGASLGRARTGNWRSWLLAAVPLAALAALLVVGSEVVYQRLATLRSADALGDRGELTLATLRAWRASPLVGSGLGTHEFSFSRYDTTEVPYHAETADNDYAQVLEESGALGAGALALFAVALAAAAWRLARRGRSSISQAAWGLVFGLLAVLVQSATDFGQRVPGVFCFNAVVAGLLVGLAKAERRLARPDADPPARWPRLAPVAALMLAAPVYVWGIRRATLDTIAQGWADQARMDEAAIADSGWEAGDDAYTRLIAFAEQASLAAPADAVHAYWLDVYRWQSLVRGGGPEAINDSAALPAQRIAEDLRRVRALCPTYGAPCLLEATIRLAALGDASAANLADKAARLAPYDGSAAVLRGRLAAAAGEASEAERWLRKAVTLDAALYPDAAEALVAIGRFEVARELAAAQAERLGALAEIADLRPELTAEASRLRDEARGAILARASSGDATAEELAASAEARLAEGDSQGAVEAYRAALAAQYRRHAWRDRLVQLLRDRGSLQEALDEARIAVRLRPGAEAPVAMAEAIEAELLRREVRAGEAPP